jgi:uncharacterized protein with NRDE domain
MANLTRPTSQYRRQDVKKQTRIPCDVILVVRPTTGSGDTAGRVSVLTNYREPSHLSKPDARGRGHLVTGWVTAPSSTIASDYASEVHTSGAECNGFNLLLIDCLAGEMVCVSNKESKSVTAVSPGVHGLTNQTLDDPWPKLVAGRVKLAKLLASLHETTATLSMVGMASSRTGVTHGKASHGNGDGSSCGRSSGNAADGKSEGASAAPATTTATMMAAAASDIGPGELADLLVRELLSDETRYPDSELPRTGCSIEVVCQSTSVSFCFLVPRFST